MTGALVEELVGATQDGDVEAVASLLQRGADPDGFSEEGETPLTMAVGQGDDNVEVVRLLLAAGADPNLASGGEFPSTPLVSAACCGGAPECIALLVTHGADPNLRTSEGTTPLYSGWGNAEVIRLLLAAGADPNAESTGDTEGLPLCGAAAWGRVESVRALVAGGADPNLAERGDRKPLSWAVIPPNGEEAVRELLAAGADPTLGRPLVEASRRGNVGAVRALLEHGASPRERDGSGGTAREVAAEWAAKEDEELCSEVRRWYAAVSAEIAERNGCRAVRFEVVEDPFGDEAVTYWAEHARVVALLGVQV